MKNKKVTALAMMMTMCMLGNSAAGAAEFSSGPPSVTDASESDSVENSNVTDADQPDVFTDSTDEEVFNAQEDAEPFSDAEIPAEFSADEETDEIPEAQDPGSIDSTLAARYKNAVVEAELEADPNVKTTCKVYNGSNLENQDYSTFGSCIDSYECTSPDGGIMRVQFGAVDGKTLVEYYDTDYNIQKTVTVPLALPKYGAFYESGNYYYILTGQDNPDNNDAVEVYRVTKYSKDWKVQGSASLYGENTKKPFDFGSARMTMNGNILYVRTCHVMYGGHQANVTFSVNADNMTVVDKKTDISYADAGYVSHSFNQFIQIDQGKMTTLDQCDAFPSRALVMLKYSADLSEGKFVPDFNYVSSEEMERRKCAKTDIMKVGGNVGDNYTGTSAGGFEYSDSCWLVAGNFDTDGAGSSRNAFIAAVPKNGGDPVVRYFTNYGGTDDSAATPHLVKTGSNSFVLMWSSQGKVYYTAVDGNGQQSGQTYSMDGNLSDCQPTMINGKISWYTWKQNVNVFYEINVSDLSDVNAVKIVNGHKYSYGTEVKDGMISRSCTVCGQDQDKAAVPVSLDPIYKKENGGLAYLRGDISLDPGVTYSVECGANFTASGERLYDCEVISSDSDVVSVNMKGTTSADITVHKSGTATLTIRSKYNPAAAVNVNISAGMLESRQYSIKLSQDSFVYDGTEHKPEVKLYKNGKEVSEDNYDVTYEGDLVNAGVVKAVVKGKGGIEGTLTKQYAIKTVKFSGCKASVSEDPIYFYEDKEYTPEFTVRDGDRVLTEGKDFTVSYRYNDRPGYAQVTFRGMGNYDSSSISEQFYINARDMKYCKITLSSDSIQATGKKIEPGVTVKFGEKTLKEGENFTVSYTNNIKPGTATVTVRGIGKYTGVLSVKFTIEAAADEKNDDDSKGDTSNKGDTGNKEDSGEKDNKDNKEDTDNKGDSGNTEIPGNKEDDKKEVKIRDCQIEIKAENLIYDGTEKKPEVIVSDNGKTLAEGQDYSLIYDNNTYAGKATVYINGRGIYTGSVLRVFEIARADAIVDASSKTITMSSKKQNIAESVTTDGKITYKSSDSKTVKISGDKFIALKPGKVVITISTEQGANYNAASDKKITITVRPLNTGKVTSKSSAKGQIKISWKAAKSVSGYQVQYSRSATMKNAKSATVKSNTRSMTLRKLSSKKNYYIRIRTYKVVNGKKYYSKWSTVDKVTSR